VGWGIAAVLIGVGFFWALRARRVVDETWSLRDRRRSTLSIALVAIAVLVFLALSGSVPGAVLGGVVIGLALYGSWRLRRV
jgi:uncharacterized membrane protein SpoIIM required for sporulation